MAFAQVKQHGNAHEEGLQNQPVAGANMDVLKSKESAMDFVYRGNASAAVASD